MEKNKEKVKLNDDLLDNVAGGGIVDYKYQVEPYFLYVCNSLRCCGRGFISDFEISACPHCGSNEICLMDTIT